MAGNDTSILIVSRPSRVRDSLRALLQAMPQVGDISYVNNHTAALEMFIKQCPAVVLLTPNLPRNEVRTILKQITAADSQVHSLVLVDTSRRQQMARAAGADSILLSGFSMMKFFITIEELLIPSKSTKGIEQAPPQRVL